MKMEPRHLIAVSALTVLVGSAAQADVWTGPATGGEFADAANWDTGVAPAGDVWSDIDGAFTVERSRDSSTGLVNVNGGATLNVTGGAHSDSRAGNTRRTQVGGSGTGTVNQSGGALDIGDLLLVGNGGGGSGTYNLTGGDLLVSRGGRSLVGLDSGNASIEIGVNGAAGQLKMSGGSLATRAGLGIGAKGVFEVAGSAIASIEIGSHRNVDGQFYQQAGGVFRAGIDAGGMTAVFVDEVDGDASADGNGDVTFDAGAVLDPYDLGGAAANVWTIVLTWEGTLRDRGLVLSAEAVDAGWDKDGRFEDFKAVIAFLQEQGCTFVLPRDLVAAVVTE